MAQHTSCSEEHLQVISDILTFLVTSTESNGAYTLSEVQTPPGTGMPPHCHAGESETCYVLDGSYTFLVGNETKMLGPHQALHLPAGTLHAYTNIGNAPGRMLLIHAPGIAHERFCRMVGGPDNPTTDFMQIMADARSCGIDMLPAHF